MRHFLQNKLSGKKILLLGFGREGQSSYSLIRDILPEQRITIADENEKIREHPLVKEDDHVAFITGPGYLDGLNAFDLVIKSPGITLKDLPYPVEREKITSQTDLFLQFYSRQVIGITGTKGKSTTSTLLHYILKRAGKEALLLGNIGRPSFGCIDEIGPDMLIVYEMSSHQLEYISRSPHIAILLNLFQEHLDAYPSFRDYQLAKLNITKYQEEDDFFIYNADDPLVSAWVGELMYTRNYLPFSFRQELADGSFVKDAKVFFAGDCISTEVLDLSRKRKLKGDHNLLNILAVINACTILGIGEEEIQEGVAAFTGLEHRLEFAGNHHGIDFFNDSIATIPEATMEAVKALEKVDTLILGGFDREINYGQLASFLSDSDVRNFIFTGDAGMRIMSLLQPLKKPDQQLYRISRFDEFLQIAIENTAKGKICLLSPAAASYDEFVNFEMRGKRFKELVGGNGEMVK